MGNKDIKKFEPSIKNGNDQYYYESFKYDFDYEYIEYDDVNIPEERRKYMWLDQIPDLFIYYDYGGKILSYNKFKYKDI